MLTLSTSYSYIWSASPFLGLLGAVSLYHLTPSCRLTSIGIEAILTLHIANLRVRARTRGIGYDMDQQSAVDVVISEITHSNSHVVDLSRHSARCLIRTRG